MSIEAGLQRYETVNNLIKAELSKRNKVTVKDVNGQRSAVRWTAARP